MEYSDSLLNLLSKISRQTCATINPYTFTGAC